MRIPVDEAREFFAHPSQHLMGLTPDNLPDEGFEYWASGPVCGVFHRSAWPGVFMGHYGVKPEGWGKAVTPAKQILTAFFKAHDAERIIGWTHEGNRAAIAFSQRLGFEVDGEMPMPNGKIIMQGWTPWH